jgi:hypothetical protein
MTTFKKRGRPPKNKVIDTDLSNKNKINQICQSTNDSEYFINKKIINSDSTIEKNKNIIKNDDICFQENVVELEKEKSEKIFNFKPCIKILFHQKYCLLLKKYLIILTA